MPAYENSFRNLSVCLGSKRVLENITIYQTTIATFTIVWYKWFILTDIITNKLFVKILNEKKSFNFWGGGIYRSAAVTDLFIPCMFPINMAFTALKQNETFLIVMHLDFNKTLGRKI